MDTAFNVAKSKYFLNEVDFMQVFMWHVPVYEKLQFWHV